MTVDERLERLTERHEALTQTVEHLAKQGEDQNVRIDKLVGSVEALVRVVESHDRRLGNIQEGH